MIELLNIDCMEYMRTLPDKAFSLAIVDPPYGLNLALNGQFKKYGGKSKWDSDRPTIDFFKELDRVSVNQIIWGWNYFSDLLPPCKGFIYWNKLNHHDNRSQGELAYCSIDGLSKHFEYMWDGNRYGTKGNIKGVGEETIRIHPTEKPIALYKWLLQNYATCKYCKGEGSYYEDVAGDGGSRMLQTCDECGGTKAKILDTHLGSGSIAIACHDYGFDLVGCELDKDYYEAALKRFNNHKSQTKLFDAATN